MNDVRKVDTKKFENVEIENDNKKCTIEIKDEKIDIDGKKDGETVDIKATVKKEGETTASDKTLKGIVHKGLFGDSIDFSETTDATPMKFKGGNRKVYSGRMHKPMIWVSIAGVVILVGGLIWWWVASSKKEDKEEESL